MSGAAAARPAAQRKLRTRWWRLAVCFAVGCAVWAIPGAAWGYDASKLISWDIGSGKWEQRMGISSFRSGCADPPPRCVSDAQMGYPSRPRRIYLAVDLTPLDAATYSNLSLSHPVLYEVGIDDFVSVYGNWSDPAARLRLMIGNLKLGNPSLRFGITLYEDELALRDLRDVPGSLRRRIDDVHLYLHYRRNAARYAEYVRRAKRLFPTAKIIAGSYAYDRIDYEPCSQVARRKCTTKQEIGLFERSLEIQARLLRRGDVSAIEFYSDDRFYGPDPTACRVNRRRQCVRNTITMRRLARPILKAN